MHREDCTEALEDARGARLELPRRRCPGARAPLTLQNACAFRAYAELRLGADARPRSAEPGVPMDQRGLLLHAALQLLWERLRDSASARRARRGRARGTDPATASRSAAQALQAEPRGRGRRRAARPDGQFDLFSRAAAGARRASAARAERLIRAAVRARAHARALHGAGDRGRGGALARRRAACACGSIASTRSPAGRVVLDYKSGRPGTPDWYGERPTHPQLLAYLAALGSEVVALATVNVTAREVRFCGSWPRAASCCRR